MKRQITIRIPAVKHRAHRALFDQALPFQPKVEKSAKTFKRKPKHPKGNQDE